MDSVSQSVICLIGKNENHKFLLKKGISHSYTGCAECLLLNAIPIRKHTKSIF